MFIRNIPEYFNSDNLIDIEGYKGISINLLCTDYRANHPDNI